MGTLAIRNVLIDNINCISIQNENGLKHNILMKDAEPFHNSHIPEREGFVYSTSCILQIKMDIMKVCKVVTSNDPLKILVLYSLCFVLQRYNNCNSDYECPGEEKCCYYDGRKECAYPVVFY